MSIRIDFAAYGCEWEVLVSDARCPKPGAGWTGEWMSVYCAEHLAIWLAEIERQNERDKARAFGLGDWWRQMNARRLPS